MSIKLGMNAAQIDTIDFWHRVLVYITVSVSWYAGIITNDQLVISDLSLLNTNIFIPRYRC